MYKGQKFLKIHSKIHATGLGECHLCIDTFKLHVELKIINNHNNFPQASKVSPELDSNY